MNNMDKNEVVLNGEQKKQINGIINMDELISGLKNEDTKNLRISRYFKWLYIVLVFVYTIIDVVNPDPDLRLSDRISGLCFVIAFAFFYFIFRYYQKMYKQIDYTEPLVVMLQKAANRYNLKLKHFLLAFFPISIVDFGLIITIVERLSSFDMIVPILLLQALFIPVFIIAGWIGYLIWKKNQKPLRDSALRLLKELEE